MVFYIFVICLYDYILILKGEIRFDYLGIIKIVVRIGY